MTPTGSWAPTLGSQLDTGRKVVFLEEEDNWEWVWGFCRPILLPVPSCFLTANTIWPATSWSCHHDELPRHKGLHPFLTYEPTHIFLLVSSFLLDTGSHQAEKWPMGLDNTMVSICSANRKRSCVPFIIYKLIWFTIWNTLLKQQQNDPGTREILVPGNKTAPLTSLAWLWTANSEMERYWSLWQAKNDTEGKATARMED